MNNAYVANTTDAAEDGILNGGHYRLHDSGCGDGGSDDNEDNNNYDNHGSKVSATRPAIVRTNRRWDLLEEQRLLVWRKEEKPWN